MTVTAAKADWDGLEGDKELAVLVVDIHRQIKFHAIMWGLTSWFDVQDCIG